jgi:hypothetical protein
VWGSSFLLTNFLKQRKSSKPQEESQEEKKDQQLLEEETPPEDINFLRFLRFKLTFLKDATIFLGTLAALLYIQVGPFNNCEGYSQWGNTGVALPGSPGTANILTDRIHGLYPAIAFISIVLQLFVIPLLTWFKNKRALGVLLQTDDGTPLFPQWVKPLSWLGWVKRLRLPTLL